jgi:RimJ/RimL family protein N-acetyltransferase
MDAPAIIPGPESIAAARVRLRRLTRDDAGAIFEMFSHPDVTRYWSAAPYTELAQAEKRIAESLEYYAKDTAYPLAVVRISDERVVGNCTLWNFHRQNRRAEVGYALARPFWGHGYMHEAMAAMIDFAFREMRLHRLEADIDPRNVPSAKILERLGFRKEGLLRERWIVDDEVSDSAVYGLLAGEWQSQQR